MKFIVNGTFASYAEKILADKDYYRQYMKSEINSAQFREAMLADKSLADVAGFNDYAVRRIALTPPCEKTPAETIINYFLNNIIANCKKCENCEKAERIAHMYDGFDEYRENIRANYNHGDFVTYVYPEDERLLYAASKIAQPKRVFMAGSYYGYLAVWAMQAVRDNGGFAVFSDIDEEVCALARKNFKKFGFDAHSEIYCEDASALLAKRTEPIDMLILDATGRHDDERPGYRGKRIYGALLSEAKHLLKKGSLIFIHNMEPENPEMKMLVDELRAINAVGENYDTFNGLGVYIVR